ncbi:MAG TPA: DUF29 domain-containing protein, partial [Allocoleopsis sp.]
SLQSNLIVVLLHLLKWQYQPALRSSSWKVSLIEHRRRLRNALKESPSLNPYLMQIFGECYGDAVEQAAAETGLSEVTFPVSCPYTIEQLLDSDFLPEADRS